MTTIDATVFVEALEILASIGIYPREKDAPQLLIVDVELDVKVSLDDDIDGSADYEEVVAIARAIPVGRHIQLVETYAHELASRCLSNSRVKTVRVRVRKPAAVPGANAAGVKVVGHQNAPGVRTPKQSRVAGAARSRDVATGSSSD
jgi:dihydroneopterin aldolase